MNRPCGGVVRCKPCQDASNQVHSFKSASSADARYVYFAYLGRDPNLYETFLHLEVRVGGETCGNGYDFHTAATIRDWLWVSLLTMPPALQETHR